MMGIRVAYPARFVWLLALGAWSVPGTSQASSTVSDPLSIVLPSGLPMYDWLAIAADRVREGKAATVLLEANGYVAKYGRIPELLTLIDTAVKAQLDKIDIGVSVASATAAVPKIEAVIGSAGEWPAIIKKLGEAKHVAHDYAGAQAAYAKWLQMSPRDDPARQEVRDALVAAQEQRPPAALLTRIQETKERERQAQLARAREAEAEAARLAAQARARQPKEPPIMWLDPRCYRMGSGSLEQGSSDLERPSREVCVAPFGIGVTEVTVDEFTRFTIAASYETDAERNQGAVQGCQTLRLSDAKWSWQAGLSWRNPGFSQGDQEPVVCVSWNDAQAYAAWLSAETGKRYRLPSDAEWEYAARGGTTTPRFWDGESGTACDHTNGADETPWSNGWSWTSRLGCRDNVFYTAPAAEFRPNQFGLYDMVGNVWEWVQDCEGGGYRDAPTDGSPRATGCRKDKNSDPMRAYRGGAWSSGPEWLRAASRSADPAFARYTSLGFRLAQDP